MLPFAASLLRWLDAGTSVHPGDKDSWPVGVSTATHRTASFVHRSSTMTKLSWARADGLKLLIAFDCDQVLVCIPWIR